jgi:hypothetical protein
MKKILPYFLFLLLILSCLPSFATAFGTYRQEYEYGLFDGVKFNLFDKKKNEKIIKLKDDVDKKIEKTEKTKEEQDKKDDDEYQMYRFMLENTIPI